jgi:hypothetical protein
MKEIIVYAAVLLVLIPEQYTSLHSGKTAGQVEKRGTSVSCIPNGMRESYDTMLIK